MRFRFGVVVGVAALATCLLVVSATAADLPPTFRVESSDLEVGPVTGGAVAVATFVFHNDGDGEVRILRAAPS